MRINEVSRKTGLTKKAIHFYVNEGLVHPQKLDNNYYEFSNKDIDVLSQIFSFRKAGISIQTIKEIYNYPAATNFFLHRSFHQLKQELAEKMIQLENLEMILETIPPNGTPIDVGKIPVESLKNESTTFWIDSKHPDFDERMIAILALAPFMDIQVDEYKQYLWDKTFNDLKLQFKDNLNVLSHLIYCLNGDQIRESSFYQFNLFHEIVETQDITPYVIHLISLCHELINNEELKQKWILLYDPVIKPIYGFFKRTYEKKRISQYNPLFDQCTQKMNQIIFECIQQIKGTSLESQMNEKLNGKFSFHQSYQCDLYILFTFSKSIYAQCTISEIEKCLQ